MSAPTFIHVDREGRPWFFFDDTMRYLEADGTMLRGIEPEFFGLFDDNRTSGRMMAIANFNNDIGDYWEWSAEGLYGDAPTADAYRLGVDYLVYAMTH